MKGPLVRLLEAPARVLPILTYPGAGLLGHEVRALVTRADAQAETQLALAARYPLAVLQTCMDLSVEAEAFGCPVHIASDEIPTVTGRRLESAADLPNLEIPEIGEGRTAVYLETARRLRREAGHRLVLAGMIGPFSLAARLCGVSEALGFTLSEPAFMQAVVERATDFLKRYAKAFKEAGADGLLMAEPTAGLLSPKAQAAYSSGAVRAIVDEVQDDRFSVILHNCAAKPVHLGPSLETGAHGLHFGAPMDLGQALEAASPDTWILGNLDPARVFVQGSPELVRQRSRELLETALGRMNFILSSGCDLPPGTRLEHLDPLFAAATPNPSPVY